MATYSATSNTLYHIGSESDGLLNWIVDFFQNGSITADSRWSVDSISGWANNDTSTYVFLKYYDPNTQISHMTRIHRLSATQLECKTMPYYNTVGSTQLIDGRSTVAYASYHNYSLADQDLTGYNGNLFSAIIAVNDAALTISCSSSNRTTVMMGNPIELLDTQVAFPIQTAFTKTSGATSMDIALSAFDATILNQYVNNDRFKIISRSQCTHPLESVTLNSVNAAASTVNISFTSAMTASNWDDTNKEGSFLWLPHMMLETSTTTGNKTINYSIGANSRYTVELLGTTYSSFYNGSKVINPNGQYYHIFNQVISNEIDNNSAGYNSIHYHGAVSAYLFADSTYDISWGDRSTINGNEYICLNPETHAKSLFVKAT